MPTFPQPESRDVSDVGGRRPRLPALLVALCGLAAFAFAVGGVLVASSPAAAAEGFRYVSAATGADMGDDAENDCASADAPCATVGHALTQASAGDTVEIADGVYTETLTISSDITLRRWGGEGEIDGVVLQACAEPQIDALCPDEAGRDRVITVGPVGTREVGRSLTLVDLTIRHGRAASGGGIYYSGRGVLGLSRVRLESNIATGSGGGIYASLVSGSNTITNSVLRANQAPNGGGAYIGQGTLELDATRVVDNIAAGGGGGMFVNNSRVTAIDSLFQGNTSSGVGGAIRQIQGNAVILVDSAITGNTASAGGGVHSTIQGSYPTLVVRGSVLSGNIAGPGFGGAIFATGSVRVANSTLTENQATRGGGIYHAAPDQYPEFEVVHSAIFGNSATEHGHQVYDAGTQALRGHWVSSNWWGSSIPSRTSQSEAEATDIFVANPSVTTWAPWAHSVQISAAPATDLDTPVTVHAALYGCEEEDASCDSPVGIVSSWGSYTFLPAGSPQVRFAVGEGEPQDVTTVDGIASIEVPSSSRGETVTATVLFGGVPSPLSGSAVATWNLPAGPPAYAVLTAGPECDQTTASMAAGSTLLLCVTIYDEHGTRAAMGEDLWHTVKFSGLEVGTVSGMVFADGTAEISVFIADARGSADLQTAAPVSTVLHASVTLSNNGPTFTTDDADGPGQGLALTVRAIDDAGLESLTVTFGGDDHALALAEPLALGVAHAVEAVTVAAVTSSVAATMTIAVDDGEPEAFEAPREVPLPVGNTVVVITVTAEDGETTETYTLTLTRALSDDAGLASLTVTADGDDHALVLDEPLALGVAHAVDTVTVAAVTSNAAATMTIAVDGGEPEAFEAPREVPLPVGKTVVVITVTAEDGETTEAYTLTLTRALSDDAGLESLTVTAGGIDHALALDEPPLALGVPHAVDTVTVAAVTSSDAAAMTIAVDGGEPEAFEAPREVPLPVGNTVVVITVTAEDGETTETYTLTLTRALSDDVGLSSLTVTAGGDDHPLALDKPPLALGVPHAVEAVTVAAVTSSDAATMTIAVGDGEPEAFEAPREVPLSVGNTVVVITVTAEDGETTETYTLTLTRAPSAEAGLASLTVTAGGDDHALVLDEPPLALGVPHAVEAVTVAAVTSSDAATMTIAVDGGEPEAFEAPREVPLSVGETVVVITVTAEDGETTETYTLTLTRAAPPAPPSEPEAPSVAPPAPSSGDPVDDLVRRSNEATSVATAGQPTTAQTEAEPGIDVVVIASAGALPGDATLTVAGIANMGDLVAAAAPPEGADLVLAFVVEAASAEGDAIREFAEPVLIQVTLPPSFMPPGADVRTLALAFWDGAAWVEVDAKVVRNEDGSYTVTASVDHFTVFSVTHQPARGQFTTPLPPRGVALTRWGGGDIALLDAALGVGRSAWIASGGRLYGHIGGAPPVVNGGMAARYAGGIPAGTVMVVVSWH
ncbi:MAG: cadherin-like beta sandwich domain-containing protein [Dehalococcoidia bacterium]|nr:cadherin-like beta sandwich domain-containing protein [Dehalococcoidia bacterium]